MSEILPRPLGAGNDKSKERDPAMLQRFARRSEEADVPPAERAVQAAKHGEQNGCAAAIFGERHGTVAIGCRQVEVWRPVTWTKRTMRGTSHL